MTRFAKLGLSVIVVTTLIISGCNGIGPGRTASGKAASRRLAAPGVTRLDIAYGFDVHVTIGQPEVVTVTYDDNLADLLDVGVDARTLRIQLEPHGTIKNTPILRAEVTVRRLEEVRIAGASTLDVVGPVQDTGLRLQISGGSRVAADLGLDRATATVSGDSHLELTGTAGTLEVDGSGASDLELAALSLQHLDIRLSGASHANVKVDQTIAAQLSGASRLTYQGTPRFTRQDTSGCLNHQAHRVGPRDCQGQESSDPRGGPALGKDCRQWARVRVGVMRILTEQAWGEVSRGLGSACFDPRRAGQFVGSRPEAHQHYSPAGAKCCQSLLLDPDAMIGIDLHKRLFLLVTGRGE